VKPKLTAFDEKNRAAAAVILEEPATYGPDCLLARWARAVVAKAPTPAVVEPGAQREAQGDLFPEAA